MFYVISFILLKKLSKKISVWFISVYYSVSPIIIRANDKLTALIYI